MPHATNDVMKRSEVQHKAESCILQASADVKAMPTCGS
jgi:hypothetical protein